MRITAEQIDPAITRIVRTVAERKLAIFAAFPDIDIDELTQAATVAVIAALAGPKPFDPARGYAFSTWVYRVASNTMIDLYRARKRTGERETKAVALKPAHATPELTDTEIHEPTPRDERWSLPLKDFVAATYRKNIFTVPKRRPGRGPQTYSPIVAATIIDLKARTNASYRGLETMIRETPFICQSLRLNKTPNFKTIQRICVKSRKSPANNRASRARALEKGQRMAKIAEDLGVPDVMSEEEAAKALNCHPVTLAQKRRAKQLPAGLYRRNAITSRIEYLVSKVKELAGAS